MTETLFHAYTPLILWTSLGLLIFRFVPQWFPRFLGRSLYWIGVPLQLLALARQSNLSEFGGTVSLPLLAPIVTLVTLMLGLMVALLVLWGWKQVLWLKSQPDFNRDQLRLYNIEDTDNVSSCEAKTFSGLESSSQGSFLLASVLGNTGFVGLAIAPSFINSADLNWAVFYSITHNLIGSYGFGVIIASYFSHLKQQNHWWMQLRDLLSLPALWAFVIGTLTQQVQIPEVIESGLQGSVGVVIASAFLLTGIRLSHLQGWKSLKLAFLPAIIRVFIVPLLMGGVTTLLLGLSGDRRLAMVLMSGVPSAFFGLILAEEYNLDRDLVASSIVLSTLLLLLVLPFWIMVFG